MKRNLLLLLIFFACIICLNSCYTYSYSVGKGSQTGKTISKKNHYVIYGLVPIHTSDPNAMAGDAKDYDIKISHTFVDGLINSLTFGVYNPTTTKVIK